MTNPTESPDPFSHADALRAMMFQRSMILSEMELSHHRGGSLRHREAARFLRLAQALESVCRAIALTPKN